MKIKVLLAISLMFCSSVVLADETIVFVRHAEKPTLGLGQLSCQGLQRSLKLGRVLVDKYGKADFIYAPNPTDLKNDKGVDYYYIRPLATIEPTAISLGLPVDVKYGFKDVPSLVGELLDKSMESKTIFVAWEHHLAAVAVEDILAAIDGESHEIKWDDSDFDTILMVKVKTDKGGKRSAILVKDNEGLNGLSEECAHF